jgi:ferrous iron transport protein A
MPGSGFSFAGNRFDLSRRPSRPNEAERFGPDPGTRGSNAMAMTFQGLKIGDRARVTGFADGDRGYRQRLLAMGLTPGVIIGLKRMAPLGDPIEISVRNFTLTLRRDEAAILKVERV